MSSSKNINTDTSAVKPELLKPGLKPLVMGILNVTPDSFSDGGKYKDIINACEQALEMARHGADLIDIGGESSRPGAETVGIAEEVGRVVPVIENLKGKLDIPISIDTRKSEVARRACKAGATIINDVSGLHHDPEIAKVAAEFDTWLVLMHMRGSPETMQKNIKYDDLLEDISIYLMKAVDKALAAGVSNNKIILDPGIGFGKTVEHNLQILKNISKIKKLGYPVLIGASRKSFIGKLLGSEVDDRLDGSLAAAIYAVINGADIIRVHDVLPTIRALKLISDIEEAD